MKKFLISEILKFLLIVDTPIGKLRVPFYVWAVAIVNTILLVVSIFNGVEHSISMLIFFLTIFAEYLVTRRLVIRMVNSE